MNTFNFNKRTPKEINQLIAARIRDIRKRKKLSQENGKNPGIKDVLEVAKNIGLKESKAKTIADEIRTIVNECGIYKLK